MMGGKIRNKWLYSLDLKVRTLSTVTCLYIFYLFIQFVEYYLKKVQKLLYSFGFEGKDIVNRILSEYGFICLFNL